MKLSLVVAQGVHEGKTIPIGSPQFLIGRDPQCQLRPASAAVSKRHCAILVREGKVVVRDFGSTNGTFVNDEPVEGEREIGNDDLLKVGPLEFRVRMEQPTAATRSPKPKPAAVSVGSPAAAPPEPADAPPDIGANDALGSSAPDAGEEGEGPRSDRIAALLLLGNDEPGGTSETAAGPPASIPDGSTDQELPSLPTDPKGKPLAKAANQGDTSSAADAILKKYLRRPRT